MKKLHFNIFKEKKLYLNLYGPTILKNFGILKDFMANQNMLEWIEPQGGCVCFPRIKAGLHVDAIKFHDILLRKYATYVGKGYWFEEDPRYIRIGYSWDTSEKLRKGLNNILRALEEAREI